MNRGGMRHRLLTATGMASILALGLVLWPGSPRADTEERVKRLEQIILEQQRKLSEQEKRLKELETRRPAEAEATRGTPPSRSPRAIAAPPGASSEPAAPFTQQPFVEGVRELLLLVERLRSDQGVTVLLSSHLLHQVQQVCDRIGIFVGGKLRACGTVDELAATLEDRWVFSVGLADVDDARALLASVKGAKRVDRSEGRWTVTADRDVRLPLHDAVTAAGGRFTHLSRDRADLDAIYHRYFGQTQEGDGQ